MRASPEYRPDDYWKRTLEDQFDLRGVGYPYLSKRYNEWLYRGMRHAVDRALERAGLDHASLSRASVLDIGSGTGYWIEYWRARGVRRIEGVDLTEASVAALTSRYPEHRFRQRDVAAPVPQEDLAAYDIISAMSILHHIVSASGWESALDNVARMLKPGGHLVLMDPMLRHKWWGPPFDAASNGRPRTLSEHVRVLSRAGVEPITVLPTATLLANPVDARTRVGFRVQELLWHKVLTPIARRERPMQVVGPALFLADRMLCRTGFMPNSKTVVFRKADDSPAPR